MIFNLTYFCWLRVRMKSALSSPICTDSWFGPLAEHYPSMSLRFFAHKRDTWTGSSQSFDLLYGLECGFQMQTASRFVQLLSPES
eukprot:s935_g17.t1